MSCTDRHKLWRRVARPVAGVALWILVIVFRNDMFFIAGTILVVFCYFLTGSWNVFGDGARGGAWRPDASPTSMLVWAEVLWLPHLEQLVAVRDGAGRVIYADQRFWR